MQGTIFHEMSLIMSELAQMINKHWMTTAVPSKGQSYIPYIKENTLRETQHKYWFVIIFYLWGFVDILYFYL